MPSDIEERVPADAKPARKRGLLAAARNLAILAALVAIGMLVGSQISKRLRYLTLKNQGYVLILDRNNARLSIPAAGDSGVISFGIRNISPHDVKILGAESNCGCTSAVDLPMVVPGNGSRELKFRLTTKPHQAGQHLEQTVKLLIDTPTPPVVMRILADVGNSPQLSVHDGL